jgi:hypothetical protein
VHDASLNFMTPGIDTEYIKGRDPTSEQLLFEIVRFIDPEEFLYFMIP